MSDFEDAIEGLAKLAFVLILVAALFIGGCHIGVKAEGRGWMKTAVERGYAHWEVSPSGEVTFKWNNDPEKPLQ